MKKFTKEYADTVAKEMAKECPTNATSLAMSELVKTGYLLAVKETNAQGLYEALKELMRIRTATEGVSKAEVNRAYEKARKELQKAEL